MAASSNNLTFIIGALAGRVVSFSIKDVCLCTKPQLASQRSV